MTYRNEAQQHLVAELRKVPQYNEIYIEKDGVQEPDIEKRKKQYEDLLNPNRDFIFKFISLPKPTPQEPPINPPIVVSNDNGHCVFKNTAVYYK